jgi:hypothetical protein
LKWRASGYSDHRDRLRLLGLFTLIMAATSSHTKPEDGKAAKTHQDACLARKQ